MECVYSVLNIGVLLYLCHYLSTQVTAAVVIMACNRAEYLRKTLESVLQFHGPYADKFPIFVSQDGTIINSITEESFPLQCVIFPDMSLVGLSCS